MIIHKDSHLDHGLSPQAVAYVFSIFGETAERFSVSITLPDWIKEVPCALYGPAVGDPPVPEAEVEYLVRGKRPYKSRIIHRPLRMTREVTVIAGPYDGHPCVLYTAFGGPITPQEPLDPNCKDRVASEQFWKDHALALVIE